MTRLRGVVAAILVLAVAAMAISACGGDDDKTSDPTATGNQAAATTKAAAAATTNTGADPTDEPTDAPATQEPGDGGDAVNACDLLTVEEVADALGISVGEPTATEVGTLPISASLTAAVTSCAFQGDTEIGSVTFDVWTADNGDAIRSMTQAACSGKETIDIGDGACWYDENHIEIQMTVNGHFVDMFLTTLGDNPDILKTLAEAVAGRL